MRYANSRQNTTGRMRKDIPKWWYHVVCGRSVDAWTSRSRGAGGQPYRRPGLFHFV